MSSSSVVGWEFFFLFWQPCKYQSQDVRRYRPLHKSRWNLRSQLYHISQTKKIALARLVQQGDPPTYWAYSFPKTGARIWYLGLGGSICMQCVVGSCVSTLLMLRILIYRNCFCAKICTPKLSTSSRMERLIYDIYAPRKILYGRPKGQAYNQTITSCYYTPAPWTLTLCSHAG